MTSTYTNYQLVTRDLQRSLDHTAKNPINARDTEYYLKNIGKIKSIDEFLGDQRIYSYAMKAYGLDDMIYAKAFMRKVLTEGVDNTKSFANRLTDERYKEFATVFNFARYGTATTTFERTRQGTVDTYIRQRLEVTQGEEDEGVRLALYFSRKASEIKNPYDILADTALLEVVKTALGISNEAMSGDIDGQAALIRRRLDLSSLKDPEGLSNFIKRFTILWDSKTNNTTAPVLTLFSSSSPSNLDIDLIMNLQNLKRGIV